MTKACHSYTRTEEQHVKGDWHRVLLAAVVPVLLVVVDVCVGMWAVFLCNFNATGMQLAVLHFSIFSLPEDPQSDLSELLPNVAHIISSIN